MPGTALGPDKSVGNKHISVSPEVMFLCNNQSQINTLSSSNMEIRSAGRDTSILCKTEQSKKAS